MRFDHVLKVLLLVALPTFRGFHFYRQPAAPGGDDPDNVGTTGNPEPDQPPLLVVEGSGILPHDPDLWVSADPGQDLSLENFFFHWLFPLPDKIPGAFGVACPAYHPDILECNQPV